MFKSKEAKAWEQKTQELIDLIVFHNDEGAKLHVAGDHKREHQHINQCMRMLRQLQRLIDNRPPGTKLPKVPRINW